MFICFYVYVLYNFDYCFASREDLVLYMCTKFCGCCLSGFGDCAHFRLPSKPPKFPFGPMDHSPWSSKNLIAWNRLKKLMQVGIDVTYMYTNFGGCGFSGFGDTTTLKNGQISLLTMDYNLWSSKKFNRLESAQKIHASRD